MLVQVVTKGLKGVYSFVHVVEVSAIYRDSGNVLHYPPSNTNNIQTRRGLITFTCISSPHYSCVLLRRIPEIKYKIKYKLPEHTTI